MSNSPNAPQRPSFDLTSAARRTMQQYGFDPDFPPEVAQQLAAITSQPPAPTPSVRDLRELLWSSIDNDTSRDLDQIEVAQSLHAGGWKLLIGIADVDAYVPQGTPIDAYAAQETTSVYTGVQMFPMLPEQLSTGTTSLLEDQDRLCLVLDFDVTSDGHLGVMQIYRALVRNKAQLTYSAVGAWLESRGPIPPKVAATPDLEAQLRLQNDIAQALKTERFRHGALNLETSETSPVVTNGEVTGISDQHHNLASQVIEEFMIAGNEVAARTMKGKGASFIRRVVKVPEHWDRIVELAAKHGATLPSTPNSKQLNDFLTAREAADPDHFADLSLAVIKLMGPGTYELQNKGAESDGHFGLAVQDYTHSTAPNRRFPDLVTQRVLKSVIGNAPPPYTDDELTAIAQNCTAKGDAARKVERAMTKRIAAVALNGKLGTTYDAIVTGVGQHGIFVRTLAPKVDGMLLQGEGVKVGDKLHVRLVHVDVEKAYIDFARA